MVSVSFVSFGKYELQMRKNFSTFFSSIFLPKKPSLKKILTPILSENVAYETLVNYTKPWTLYLVLVLRNRGSNIKKVKNSVFSKLLFKKNHEAEFFSKFFFDEIVAQESAQLLVETLCPYLLWVLRNLPHKFEKLAHVTKSAKEKTGATAIARRLRADDLFESAQE